MPTELLPHIELNPQDTTPNWSIIWMHGLGADGGDFVPMAEELELPMATRFVFPHAPTQPVTINGGYVMRAWYDIVYLDDLTRTVDEQGLAASVAAISALIDREIARGIPAEHIILGGFSQGGAVALSTALHYPQRLGAVVALSTYIPAVSWLEPRRSDANQGLPVFMGHGFGDTVVHLKLGERARDTLQGWGHAVAWHQYGMPHSVCPEEIADLRHWLLQRCSAPKP